MDTVNAVVIPALQTCKLEKVGLRGVGRSDVVVKIEASGICHSDVAIMTGDLVRPLPVVAGHEGAGRVLEVGADVTSVRVGDRVVLSAIPSCGRCHFCSRGQSTMCEFAASKRKRGFQLGGNDFDGASGLGTLADAVVVDEAAVVRVTTDLAAEQLAMLGCAVMTGTGSALNLANLETGDCALVIGAGGVGLSAIQGARARGASLIISLDPSQEARQAALRSGATHVFAPGAEAEESIRALTNGRGVDSVLECVGHTATMQTAFSVSRTGATIVVIGVGNRQQTMPVPIVDIALTGKKLVGCVYGGSHVHRDVARYVAMAERGELDFTALLGRTISLADAPTAMVDPTPRPGRTVVVNR